MKNVVCILCIGLFPVFFFSCSKSQDLSVLEGYWESESFDFEITPADPLIKAAVEKDFLELNDVFRICFGEGNLFREYRLRGDQQLSMYSGNYFYNHGYKGKYVIGEGLYGNLFLDFELRDDGLILCRFDATRRYGNPTLLEELGVPDIKEHPLKKAEVVIFYKRTEPFPQ